jgi:hypothetical protein
LGATRWREPGWEFGEAIFVIHLRFVLGRYCDEGIRQGKFKGYV